MSFTPGTEGDKFRHCRFCLPLAIETTYHRNCRPSARRRFFFLMSSKRFARFSAIACALIAFVAVLLPLSSAAGSPAPTFNRDVAPIIFKHCANCHRSGEIAASMPLTSYEEVQPLGQSIKEAVVQRTMPPWPADPDKSVKFRNDPRLSQQEIDTLVAWIDAGAPKGDGAPPPLPAADQGWLHPGGAPPDLVVPLPTYHIPATGEVPYVRFLAKVPFPDDKWISAIQVSPQQSCGRSSHGDHGSLPPQRHDARRRRTASPAPRNAWVSVTFPSALGP